MRVHIQDCVLHSLYRYRVSTSCNMHIPMPIQLVQYTILYMHTHVVFSLYVWGMTLSLLDARSQLPRMIIVSIEDPMSLHESAQINCSFYSLILTLCKAKSDIGFLFVKKTDVNYKHKDMNIM
jgi:hypothetical protein